MKRPKKYFLLGTLFVVLSLVSALLTRSADAAEVTPTKATFVASPAVNTQAAFFRDSLSVGPIYWTGKWHCFSSCTGMGPPAVAKIMKRSFHACKGQSGGAVQNCMDGIAYFTYQWATCLTTCTEGGMRGSQICQARGSDTEGFSSDVTSCTQVHFNGIKAVHVVEADHNCFLSLGWCDSYDWHINIYSGGTVTGPFVGIGA